jgi:3-isopropylmalate dehydratase small subunit
MEKFTKLSGPAAPLMRVNVDTDLIIRIQRLVGTGRTGLGPYAFENLRFLPDGSENPDFVLNKAPYREAPILLAGTNFGCGSSREGAVWALRGADFQSAALRFSRTHTFLIETPLFVRLLRSLFPCFESFSSSPFALCSPCPP